MHRLYNKTENKKTGERWFSRFYIQQILLTKKIRRDGLFYQIDDSLECLRIIHREVGESFAVERNVLLC
jgi:hypothetical protein